MCDVYCRLLNTAMIDSPIALGRAEASLKTLVSDSWSVAIPALRSVLGGVSCQPPIDGIRDLSAYHDRDGALLYDEQWLAEVIGTHRKARTEDYYRCSEVT